MQTKYIVFSLIICLYSVPTIAGHVKITIPTPPKKMVVTVPVADIRLQPKEAPSDLKLPSLSSDNPLQLTQVLYGEYLLAFKERGEWVLVQAVEQQKDRKGIHWLGRPGWIKKEQVVAVTAFPPYNLVVTKPWAQGYKTKPSSTLKFSIGTRLRGTKIDAHWWRITLHDGTEGRISTDNVYQTTAKIRETLPTLRQQIVNTALTFNGSPYAWGGRSAPRKAFPTAGVDCSALINLSYRAAGLDVPRVAHEQFLYATPIKRVTNLKSGDLVFLAPTEKPDRMNHVMMYIGNEKLIEATGSDGINRTRIVAFKQKLGRPLAGLKNGQPCGNVIVHFGSLLSSQKFVTQLRSQALRTSYDQPRIATTSKVQKHNVAI